MAERKRPGVVVLGGDVHVHGVADLKLGFDDPMSPVIASAFCGTAVSSLGLVDDARDAAGGMSSQGRGVTSPRPA